MCYSNDLRWKQIISDTYNCDPPPLMIWGLVAKRRSENIHHQIPLIPLISYRITTTYRTQTFPRLRNVSEYQRTTCRMCLSWNHCAILAMLVCGLVSCCIGCGWKLQQWQEMTSFLLVMHAGGENFQFASRCESSIKIRQDQALQRLTKPIQIKKKKKK